MLFPGALGDAVCLEPTVANLARSGPVMIYARGGAAEVARLFPDRPQIASLDGPEIARLFGPLPAGTAAGSAAEDERERVAWLDRFERIVSFTGASERSFCERLASTRRALVAPFPRGVLGMHASDYFLRRAIGDPSADAGAPRLLAPHRSGERRGLESTDPHRRPVLALHPGAGSATKLAPLAVFEQLARRWIASTGGAPLVLSGPADADVGITLARSLGCRLVEPATIAGLAAELAAADAFAGNDSGPSHVAAALGITGVAFFTSSDPASFAPRGSSFSSIVVGSPCDAAAIAARAWRALAPALP